MYFGVCSMKNMERKCRKEQSKFIKLLIEIARYLLKGRLLMEYVFNYGLGGNKIKCGDNYVS